MTEIARKSLKVSLGYWNGIFADPDMKSDDWLDNYKPLIEEAESFVDLGCGNGNDTDYLLKMGKSVVACDQSPVALGNLRNRFANEIKDYRLQLKQFNFMDEHWPLAIESFQVVIADLSLHYFLPHDFRRLLNEVWFRLTDGDGRLLFRINSLSDPEYLKCSMGGLQIDTGIIQTESGMVKYYFHETNLRHYLEDFFEIEDLHEEDMPRYGKDKVVWRGCARANYRSWYYPLAYNKLDAHKYRT